MKFLLRERSSSIPAGGKGVCYLSWNTWDDFGYKTTYNVAVQDSDGEAHDLGSVRIISKDQKVGVKAIDLKQGGLGDRYCSLGSDRRYYAGLMGLPEADRRAILLGLRDCAYEPARYERFKDEDAFKASILRSATARDVLVNYPRILAGQADLTPFAFSYVMARSEAWDPASASDAGPVGDQPVAVADSEPLRFTVRPGSKPPSNVHVLIGRNGVGKTRVLAGMADALTDNQAASFGITGRFDFTDGLNRPSNDFLNLVIVSFSAFDRFDPIPAGSARTDTSLPFYYIGIKKFVGDKNGKPTDVIGIKSPSDLNDDFKNALKTICQDADRMRRWVRALEILSSDPGIKDLRPHEIGQDGTEAACARITGEVARMSSGHKIVLLTITCLIENVSDRSLVLLDEPETHLHPPLLGSFMRALSELLVESNAVAVVATHSPVVLQEVPAKCVWRLLGSHGTLQAKRPENETFAENVSVLTRKVFGLEVEQSGFYGLLSAEAKTLPMAEIEQEFGSQIGAEGRALLRALTWAKA